MIAITTSKLATRCPHCTVVNDRHSLPGMATPKAGDVSICWQCKQLALFTDEQGTLRTPTQEELAVLMADPDVIKAVQLAKREIGPLTATAKQGMKP